MTVSLNTVFENDHPKIILWSLVQFDAVDLLMIFKFTLINLVFIYIVRTQKID
jgi:hypothetical protein